MIDIIKNNSNINIDEMGIDICNLITCVQRGIPVVDTIFITNLLFKQYIEERKIDDKIIDSLMDKIKKNFNNPKSVFVQTSFKSNIKWIPTNLEIDFNENSIISTLENIFNAWFSPKVKAHRSTNFISEESSYPSIYFQKAYEKIDSFVTRSPATGQRTCNDNLDNVHNTIDTINENYSNILSEIEKISGHPSKIYFHKSSNIEICRVGYYEMTLLAEWVSINELLENEIIDEIKFLVKIKPSMISEYIGKSPAVINGIQLSGKPVSDGIAIGRLIFPGFNDDKSDNSYIFCCEKFNLQMENELKNSSGAFTSHGNATSHLSVISRGMSIPAVVGVEFSIDQSNRILIARGETYKELSYVSVDGEKGNVVLSSDPINFHSSYQVPKKSEEYIQRVKGIIETVTNDSNSFKTLHVDIQKHIALLKNKFLSGQ